MDSESEVASYMHAAHKNSCGSILGAFSQKFEGCVLKYFLQSCKNDLKVSTSGTVRSTEQFDNLGSRGKHSDNK